MFLAPASNISALTSYDTDFSLETFVWVDLFVYSESNKPKYKRSRALEAEVAWPIGIEISLSFTVTAS